MKLKKYKFYIPSFVTLLGLLSSIGAIHGYLYGEVSIAVSLFILAFIFDILDGFLARKLEAETKLGAWADSISDVFLYIILPSVLLITVCESVWYFWVALSVFVLSGLVRLFKFTSEGFVTENGRVGYLGLPVFVTIPITASLLLGEVDEIRVSTLGITVILLMLAVAMKSRVFVPKIMNHAILTGGMLTLLIIFVYSVIK